MTHQLFNPSRAILMTSGLIRPSWKVEFFLTTTTTPTPVYTTSALSTTHTQPVEADAGGVLPAIYLDPSITYKASYYDENDVLQYTDDPVNDNLLSQEAIAELLYPRTASEIAAGVTPTNYAYPTGNVLRYGADPSALSDSAAAFQNAIDSSYAVYVPDGDYLINTGLTYGDYTHITFSGRATLKAGANSLTFFTVGTHAYLSWIESPIFDGNGNTGVTCFDWTGVRETAGVANPRFLDVAVGIICRDGCYGTHILNPSSTDCPAPIQVIANASSLLITKPTLDNGVSVGGSGAGIGIDVQAGSGDNIGVRIVGGYVQGFATGIKDAGIGTIVDGTYLEVNSDADIEGVASCRGGRYIACQHFGPTGAAAYKMRNTDACTVIMPQMASGSRTAMYDVDNTNTNFARLNTGSNASLNTPEGTLTYVGDIPKQLFATFTPVVVGTSAAGTGTYTTQAGRITKTGRSIKVELEVTWSAHTGTGNIEITGVPTTLSGSANETVPASFTPTRMGEIWISTLSWTGPHLTVVLSGSSTTLRPYQIDATGAASLVPIGNAGAIIISIEWTV